MNHCAIVGATGYTGLELIKILSKHSEARLTYMTTRQKKAIPVRSLIPTLSKDSDLHIEPFSLAKVKREADLVFVCLPHTEAMVTVQDLRKAGKVVIDLSADYRLKSAALYKSAYGLRHRYPARLKEAVYGLTELFRDKVQMADLISNPGCYPTGALLGLAPLLTRKLIKFSGIVIDSKSGVTGAGKKYANKATYAEIDENFYAYKVNRHQHVPEMAQTMKSVAGKPVSFNFVPHLLPVQRGILSVLYLEKKPGVSAAKIRNAFKEDYTDEYFIRVRDDGEFPKLKDVQGTNFCDIGLTVESKTGRIIVITAIDNLVKGASGQAVQNMNVRFGYAEEEGLIP